jgi:hypothetical protein
MIQVLRILAIAVVYLLTACTSSHEAAAARQRYWDAELARALPPGKTRSEVDSYFTSRGIEHNFQTSDGSLVAIEPGAHSDGLVTTEVSIRCQLDQSGRLVSCRTSLVRTGP